MFNFLAFICCWQAPSGYADIIKIKTIIRITKVLQKGKNKVDKDEKERISFQFCLIQKDTDETAVFHVLHP